MHVSQPQLGPRCAHPELDPVAPPAHETEARRLSLFASDRGMTRLSVRTIFASSSRFFASSAALAVVTMLTTSCGTSRPEFDELTETAPPLSWRSILSFLRRSAIKIEFCLASCLPSGVLNLSRSDRRHAVSSGSSEMASRDAADCSLRRRPSMEFSMSPETFGIFWLIACENSLASFTPSARLLSHHAKYTPPNATKVPRSIDRCIILRARSCASCSFISLAVGARSPNSSLTGPRCMLAMKSVR
mmetsp:Transcript_22025/g.54889  ORF Transcript_22025/g.54889 Transcript_22025/m.54889 type:complete len:246 (-) Transcript_22025:173-910(-)